MQVIRLLHIREYNKFDRRFTSQSFQNIRGTISIIQCSCITGSKISICEHIDKYYAGIGSKPAIFWCFDTCTLPKEDNLEIFQEESETGDVCHFKIKKFSNNRAKKFFRKKCADLRDIKVCMKGKPVPATAELLEELASLKW